MNTNNFRHAINKRVILLTIFMLIVVLKPVQCKAESLGGFSYFADHIDDDKFNEVLHNVKVFKLMNCITCEDLMSLLKCTEAEAEGGTVEQKLNVASCIINRVISDYWGDTVVDVVECKGQFAVVSNGRYYNVKISPTTLFAVNQLMQNGTSHMATYFCTPDCSSAQSGGFHDTLDYLFYDGMHNYYMETN